MNAIIEQINSTGIAFLDFALPMLIQSSLLIAVLLTADFLLRKKVRAVFRYWLWMLILVKLVLPVTLSSPASLANLVSDKLPTAKITTPAAPAEPAPALIETTAQPLPITLLPPQTATEAAQPKVTAQPPLPLTPPTSTVQITWQAVVFLAWLVVVLALALLLLQRAIFVRSLVAQAKTPNGLMNDALQYCRKKINLASPVTLKISPNAASPAVCGLWRPVILVPQDLAPTLGASQLRMVLLHELAHIKRGDLWLNLIQTLLQIAYFYNPLLWLANWLIRGIREQAVDEAVQAALGEKAADYPATLVNVAKLAFKRPALSLRLIGVVESKSALTQRVKRMLSRPIPKTAKLSLVSLIAIIITAAVLLPMAKAKPKQQTNSKFITTLSNGVTVELVGVCNYPSAGKQWWAPDGSRLESEITTEDRSTYTSKLPGYEIAFKVDGPDYNFRRGSIKGSEQGSTLKVIEPEDIVAYRVHIKPGLSKTKIRAAAAAGKWKTVASHSGHGTTFGKVKRKKVIFSAANESENGLVITVSDDLDRKNATRLVVIDKNGMEHKGKVQTSLSVNNMRQQAFAFSNILLKNITEFAFQTRPYEYATFKNVALKPNFKTNVQITGKQPTEPEQKTDYSTVTVKEGVGFDGIIVGDPKCTGDFIKSKLGKPDEETKNEKDWWFNYNKTNLGFWVNPRENTLYEIRLNNGFKGKLTSGISLSSTKEQVFAEYGQPVRIQTPDDFDKGHEDQVLLYRKRVFGKPNISKIYYEKNGLLFWFDKDKLNQIVISRPAKKTAVQVEQQAGLLPNIFVLEPKRKNSSDFSIWDEVLEIVKDVTWHKTGRNHEKEHYDSILIEGIWNKKPGDVLVLSFSLDTPERIPSEYQDLLPKPWPEIEEKLKQGETVEFSGNARNLNIILLAAPTRAQLQPLIQQSNLIRWIRTLAKDSSGEVDVAIETLSITPNPDTGTYSVTAAIHNYGPKTSPQFFVYFYRGNPNNVKPMSHGAGPIKPAKVWNERSSSIGLSEGTNEIFVRLDPANLIEEPDETNNQAALKVVIKNGRIIEKTIKLNAPTPSATHIQVNKTYIIGFKPTGSFQPQTAKQLLDAFNKQVQDRVTTHHFRTAISDNKLFGYILANNETAAKSIAAMLNESELLDFMYHREATEQDLTKHYAMGQPALKRPTETAERKIILKRLEAIQNQRVRVQRDLNQADDALEEVRRRFGIIDLQEHSYPHPITARLTRLQKEQDDCALEIRQLRTMIQTLQGQTANQKTKEALAKTKGDLAAMNSKHQELDRLRREARDRNRDLDLARVQYRKRAAVRDERKQMLNAIKSQIEELKLAYDLADVKTKIKGGAKVSRTKIKKGGAHVLRIEVDEETEVGPKYISLRIPLADLKAGKIILPQTAKRQMKTHGITIEQIIKTLEYGTGPTELLRIKEISGKTGNIVTISLE